ncbi:dehydrogenase/reductase SDR family member on chromosome X isoform X1 [Tachysurus fulvidraco]|uniref:dehydrogenase/reductase SDR family member on chromosome X isoform X1 n=1 Tax=Tachysurus fulvidraco TaxID=1234273 RepID=UPI001FEF69B8|nr:dehydrogenase/reductase SDR family member on chromosome X isoform X1 [Tachysurus fulvidraco]
MVSQSAMWRLLAFILPVIRLYFIGVKVLIYQLLHRSFTLPVLPRQNGRVAIVTGGARGMGYETSRHLASLGTHVVIAGNEEEEGLIAVKKIQKESGHRKVEFMCLDLASLQSVRQFVQRFKAKGLPLHILVNNAGVMLVPERKTEDGFELHFGLNYLGHFLLTNLLLDMLRDSGQSRRFSRIVTVSSATHYGGRLDLNDLQGRPRPKEHPRPCTQPSRLSWRESAACTCTTARRRSPLRAPTISGCRKSCGPRAVPWWGFRKPEEESNIFLVDERSGHDYHHPRRWQFHFALCLLLGILCDSRRSSNFLLL